jgi:hypothetical protein
VGLRAGLDTEARGAILCLCRGSNPSLSVCSQPLYCLGTIAPKSKAVPPHAMKALGGEVV